MSESMENVSVSLGRSDFDILQHHVENGRFASRSEAIRAGLRLLDDLESSLKLKRLRAEIEMGAADVTAGHVTSYDTAESLFDDIMRDD